MQFVGKRCNNKHRGANAVETVYKWGPTEARTAPAESHSCHLLSMFEPSTSSMKPVSSFYTTHTTKYRDSNFTCIFFKMVLVR